MLLRWSVDLLLGWVKKITLTRLIYTNLNHESRNSENEKQILRIRRIEAELTDLKDL